MAIKATGQCQYDIGTQHFISLVIIKWPQFQIIYVFRNIFLLFKCLNSNDLFSI